MNIKEDCYVRIYSQRGLVATFTPSVSAEEISIELVKLITQIQDRD